MGSIFSFSTMYAIFAVIVMVFPVPAPAKYQVRGWVCLREGSWGQIKGEEGEFSSKIYR